MRTRKPLVSLVATAAALALWLGIQSLAEAQNAAPVTDPLPAVEKRGLEVEIRDLVRLPQTRGLLPSEEDTNPAGWARVSFVRDIADGRRFANDSRGFLRTGHGAIIR